MTGSALINDRKGRLFYFNGVSVLPAQHYKTPLGKVKINRELCYRIAELDDSIHVSWEGHKDEHSLEVQLPFLQRTLGEFELIPIVMGDQNYDCSFNLGEAIAKLVRHENALVVASTDLSHYYPASEAEKMGAILQSIVDDPQPLRARL